MKKLFFLVIMVIASFSVYAQQIKPETVPQVVLDRFHHVFPQSVDLPVTWVREKGDYKATLTIMDGPATMVLDSLGKTKRIERKINEIYLPENAKAYLKKLDPDYLVVIVTKIVDDKERVTYKTTAKVKTNFTFDEKGTLSGAK